MSSMHEGETSQNNEFMEFFIKGMEGEHSVILDSLIQAKLKDPSFPLDINICTLKAATKGDAIVLTKLLSLHPRMSYGDEHNRRAIHYAANNGHLECVRLLLKAGAISNCADNFGRTPLHMACAMGFTEIVRLLVKQCGQINSCRTESGENAVHATAAAGHVEIMEFLIEHGGDINATTSKLKGGETPLHKAISADKPEMVDLLCRYDAKLNIADASGRYPMHLACEKGFQRCIATLVQHGASLEVTDAHGQTPLFAAVSENQVTIAKFLIEQGANVLAVDSSGYTPLHRASYKGNLELIEYLVHSGAEINARSQKTLQTPLMFAVTFGKLEAIKKLIELGGDTTLPDAKGQTPLHLVHLKMTGEPVDKIVRALLEGGGRLDQRDDGNFTPLQRCLISGVIRRNHSLPCIQLLCQAGSYLGPDQYTMGKKSPLFWLAYSGFLQEAMYLVKAGWDLRDETWIILPGKDHLQDKLHEFMIITYRTVPSLLACTRKGLRAHLFEVNQHREILSIIDCLPLPSPLKSYLKLQDVDPYDLEALSFVE